MSSPLADVLARIRAAAEHAGVRWYIFGAQAAILMGASRLTADIDVTMLLGQRDVTDLLAALESRGFRLRIPGDPEGFIARTRVLPMVDAVSNMPVDVVLGGPGLEEAFADRADVLDVGGILVPVISPEDLIVTKVLASRPKDLDDVVAVLAARRDDIDAAQVRSTLRLLEGALGQSDLLPAFEKLWEAARR